MGLFGEIKEGQSTPPPTPTPLPGTGGTILTLTGPELATGQVLDATSDRYMVVAATTTGAGGQADVSIGPDSGHTTTVEAPAVANGVRSVLALYVPKGWFVQSAFFNATFTSCKYW